MGTWPGPGAFQRALDGARAGDDEGFADLWRWLHPGLLRWLTVVAPGVVDDVASEVWISVARGIGSFDGDAGDFRGWVYTIARRRAIDWARRSRRQPVTTPLDGIDVADPVAVDTRLVDAAEARDAALRLLRRLSPDQREVVALRAVVGMTVAETAAIVRKSEGAVRVLCHRGLRSLAAHLDAERVAVVTS